MLGPSISHPVCFNFVNEIALLCKFTDHVKCMCEEFMQEPAGKKGFDKLGG